MSRIVLLAAVLLGLVGCVARDVMQFGTHEKAAWLWMKDADRGEGPHVYRCKEYAANDVVCIKARIAPAQTTTRAPAPAPAAPTPSPAASPAPSPAP